MGLKDVGLCKNRVEYISSDLEVFTVSKTASFCCCIPKRKSSDKVTKIEIMAGVVAGFVKKYGIFNVSMLLGLPVFGYAHLRLEKKVI